MKVEQQHSNLIICLLCNSLAVFVFNSSLHLLSKALFFVFLYFFVDAGQEPEHLAKNARRLSQPGHTLDVLTRVYTK